jgi:hypothetical protein
VNVMHALYLAQIGLRVRPCRMISCVLAGSNELRQLRHAACRVDPGSERRVDGRGEIVRLAGRCHEHHNARGDLHGSRTKKAPHLVQAANEEDGLE